MPHKTLYLTTGEFAKLCHTTKHTLFHYCDIGLFEPAYTDENGYRNYHVLQYDTFLTIAQLRKIGMPLSEMKHYMQLRTPQRMVALYEEQEQSISKQIAALTQIKEGISGQKNNMMEALAWKDQYRLETKAESCLQCSNLVPQTDDYAMTTAISTLLQTASGAIASNTLGMICGLTDVRQAHDLCRFYIYTDAAKTENGWRKTAGTYLTAYHQGTYETLQQSVEKLVFYGAERRMNLENWVYAEAVIGDWAVRDPQDYVIKISVRVMEDNASKA